MKRILICLTLVACCICANANVTYTKEDSLKITNFIKEGREVWSRNHDTDLMLFYGHKLRGVPYVAQTLEVNKTEQLVVNIHELDCTTFVETVLAMKAVTVEKNFSKAKIWDDFCKHLQKIRYKNNSPENYASRNHYFIWWAENNKKKGYVTLPLQQMQSNRLLAKQKIHINYMSTHPNSYPMLKNDKLAIREISKMEKTTEGKVMMYVPKKNLGLSKEKLFFVKDGDILAICTKKLGLDTTHIGIAEWGADGYLHLLNASQIRKKVVLEPMKLSVYMSRHPLQLGVWVLSVN